MREYATGKDKTPRLFVENSYGFKQQTKHVFRFFVGGCQFYTDLAIPHTKDTPLV